MMSGGIGTRPSAEWERAGVGGIDLAALTSNPPFSTLARQSQRAGDT
jgi:hypothetical protein